MFGFIKSLFAKPASSPPAAAPMTEQVVSTRQTAPSPAPTPAPKTRAPSPAPSLPSDVIGLPLNEILSRLPNGLAARVVSRPEGTFSFPASVAVEQLRTGAVRIPFGQLRQGSPPGTFADNPADDDTLVELPLALVLGVLGPARLARRADQKQTAVPDEETGVFKAKHGQKATVAPTVPVAAAAPVEASPPTPAAEPPPSPVVPKTTTPVVPKLVTPVLPKPAAPVSLPAATPKPTTSIAAAPAAPKATAPAASALPFATHRPAPKLPIPPPAAPVPTGDKVTVPLESLSAAWPEAVRIEIQQFNLSGASLSIPVKTLEAGLRTGRVVFTWAEVCGWLTTAPPLSPQGGSQVELPLKVIAPLFMAKHRAAAPRKVVSVGDNVPDLFEGLNRPPAPEVVPPPASVAAPNVFGEIFGEPTKTDWTPQEINQRILAMPGVAGSLIASTDGLLVAGQMPAPLKAEMMAAFLPQIFARTGESCAEMQLGTLRSLRLTASQAPCAIFRAGALYLAVLGQSWLTVPEPLLERIAGELSQLNH